LQQAGGLFSGQQVRSGLATVTLSRAELALSAPAPDAAAALALADAAAADFEAVGLAEGQVRAEALRAGALLQIGHRVAARGAFGVVQARAQALQLLSLQAVALTGQGQVAEAEGRLLAARSAYEQALAVTESQRRALPGDEFRSAFLADHLLPYQGLLRLALLDDDRGDPGAAARVLRRLDGFRARALADRLQQGAGATADAGTEALRAQVNWLYRREQRQRAEGESSPALAAHIRQAEGELLERSRRQRLDASSPTGPTGSAEAAFDPAELQSLLAAGDAVVAYGVAGDELFACVVTRRGVQLQRRVASWQVAQQALRSLRFQLDTLRVGAAPVAGHLPLLAQRARARLQQVHALVWAPLQPLLHDLTRVLVVPQGPLAGVPFAALHDGTEPLVCRHQLALAPSVQVALHGLRRRPRPAEQVRAFGSALHLPHVQTEAQRVAARFAAGQAFIGSQASLAALARKAPQADLLHLACHAQFRGDNPMFSALHLADGALTAEAVERLPLRPCTVVLSACDTALSSPDAADDRVGLVRAFLVAGAARVLASLWPVDDALTEVFMQHLHTALAAGQAPAAALRLAQLALMREQPHPCHWAAFTLHGGW
jgi:CHAT domain-containing protein